MLVSAISLLWFTGLECFVAIQNHFDTTTLLPNAPGLTCHSFFNILPGKDFLVVYFFLLSDRVKLD